jgi:hypothetical protein
MHAPGANIVVDEQTPQLSALSVLFKTGGHMVTDFPTGFRHFSVSLSRSCPQFIVAIAHLEIFVAEKEKIDANLTINNNQKSCIFHLSHTTTKASVNHSKSPYFRNSPEECNMMGDGRFRLSAKRLLFCLGFRVQRLCQIRFQVCMPEGSTLPCLRANYSAKSDTARLPPMKRSWRDRRRDGGRILEGTGGEILGEIAGTVRGESGGENDGEPGMKARRLLKTSSVAAETAEMPGTGTGFGTSASGDCQFPTVNCPLRFLMGCLMNS